MAHSTRLAWKVLLPLLSLVAAESCARILSTVDDDLHRESPEGDWFVVSKDLGWARRPGFDGWAYGAMRRFDGAGFVDLDSAEVRPSSRRRIVVVGDSTAFGNGVPPSTTWAEDLERSLGDTDVINLAVPGYTSYQGYLALQQIGLALKPDVVIVSFSFNDRRGVEKPEDQDGPARFARLARQERLSPWRLSYLFRGLAALWDRRAGGGHQIDLETLTARVPPEAYRRNLSSIARLAREQGSAVVFLLLSDNHGETPPVEALARMEAHDFAAAVELLRPHHHDVFEWLRKRNLGIALDKSGRAAEAEWDRHVPWYARSAHGGGPIYWDREYQVIMREVAAREGVALADGATVLDADPSLFIDFVHFNERGHQKIAALLRDVVLELRRGR